MNSLDRDIGKASNPKIKSVRLYRNRGNSRATTEIKKCHFLGFYSMNSNYEFRDDLSQLRYLTLPPNSKFQLDLKINSDSIIRKKCTTNEVKLDSILKWVISHRQECTNLEKRSFGDFVTFRGVLSKIMCSPYENFEGWIVCASMWKGTIYLCKYDTPEKVKSEESRTSKEKEMSDWGYKFEQFVLSEHPGSPPDISVPNNHNEEFACVLRATIGPHNLVYAAEMDGIKLRNQEPNFAGIGNDCKKLKEMLECRKAEFVELKTSADASVSDWEWKKICRFKSCKWWAQCCLVNIEDLICGYRDKEGIVRKLETFSVRKLPKLGNGFWDPNVCIQYLVDFLNLVVETVSSGRDEQLWMFTWHPKKQPDFIQVELCDENSPYSFLHKWATDGLTSSSKRKNEESSEGSSGSDSKKK